MRYGKGRERGDNNLGEENGPISPKLMRLPTKHTDTLKHRKSKQRYKKEKTITYV